MLKSIIFILSILSFLILFIQANPHNLHEQLSPSTAVFIKPKANILRRLNPLKLLFTVAYTPTQIPHYKIEWNLPFLKTMLLESTHVTNDDKDLFSEKFINTENDYANWTPEQHNELERFTEKYFNMYQSPDLFLPFIDCPALTYAITDEMLNDVHPNINEEKRTKVRKQAVERLCDFE
ncbi:unnamed protein product [Adineta steineri]|uniref:Uncharacterized protein n=1 Tax=Adineta steineri TaxID=433720 RepID=A0A815FKU0_9BILA|nr:unnamed protein product [Adineta steineri]CAF1428793.1 unnamed protein product [Adineta steineri]CAF1467966.1 unnamed protein product [Adineta steineri]CAF1479049.1 unnamed protein product [Adineta steineri]CAF1534996.1 unnamed protein product [Adineta steineri]